MEIKIANIEVCVSEVSKSDAADIINQISDFFGFEFVLDSIAKMECVSDWAANHCPGDHNYR